MDILQTTKLIKKDGSSVSFEDGLKDKKIIGLYFSAHWCPPCRKFTPSLNDAYTEMEDDSFEIVFVSSDSSSEDLLKYMNDSHGDWLAIEHGHESIRKLSEKFGIQGIPALIIFKNDSSSTVITYNGRDDITKKGPGALKDWSA